MEVRVSPLAERALSRAGMGTRVAAAHPRRERDDVTLNGVPVRVAGVARAEAVPAGRAAMPA